jgi:Protein of unknown function (DUF4058)
MPSPFPGMDPYLEDADFWSDLHATLIPLIRGCLTPFLPAGYAAKIDQYVWLQNVGEERIRHGKSDVFLANGHGRATEVQQPTATPGIAVALPAMRKRKSNRFVSIVDSRRNKVITVIELFSPSNKEGDDRDMYMIKRLEYLALGANLVEIDLLRSGTRSPMGKPVPPAADYIILVSRAEEYPKGTIWPFTVRDPIPVFPVPLKKEHGSILLNLRPCLDRAYDEAGYATQIDYTQPSAPPLRLVDAEWANEFLKKGSKKVKR